MMQRPITTARRRGISTIEAALVMPIILALVFGAVEFGWYFFVAHSVQGAAREGARSGIVAGGTQQDVLNAVERSMAASGFSGRYNVVVESPGGGAINVGSVAGGEAVRVRVDADWDQVRPGVSFISAFTGSAIFPPTVRGDTVMRKEG